MEKEQKEIGCGTCGGHIYPDKRHSCGIELTQGRCLECNEPLHIVSDYLEGDTEFRVCYKKGCARRNIVVMR